MANYRHFDVNFGKFYKAQIKHVGVYGSHVETIWR